MNLNEVYVSTYSIIILIAIDLIVMSMMLVLFFFKYIVFFIGIVGFNYLYKPP